MTSADRAAPAAPGSGTRLLVRLWWLTFARGAFAVLLGLAMVVGSESRSAIATFIGVYWLLGALLTARFALAIRWDRGSRLGLVAGGFGFVAAVLVLLRGLLDDAVAPERFVVLLGVAALLMGLLRLFGAFEVERRTGRRWTLGGLALGSVEVVLGLALLAAADTGTVESAYLAAAAWALVGGTLLMVSAWRARRLAAGAQD